MLLFQPNHCIYVLCGARLSKERDCHSSNARARNSFGFKPIKQCLQSLYKLVRKFGVSHSFSPAVAANVRALLARQHASSLTIRVTRRLQTSSLVGEVS